jgi:hypothetical protein
MFTAIAIPKADVAANRRLRTALPAEARKPLRLKVQAIEMQRVEFVDGAAPGNRPGARRFITTF